MARLTVTENARADLREILDYIAKDNPAAARRVIERLRAQARQLAATPGIEKGMGRMVLPVNGTETGRKNFYVVHHDQLPTLG
jgi:plasmid stabilization system protein ParE